MQREGAQRMRVREAGEGGGGGGGGSRGDEECLRRQTQEEELGEREEPAARGPTDTMLRLNIRCLNNQARFDPRRDGGGERRRKGEGS